MVAVAVRRFRGRGVGGANPGGRPGVVTGALAVVAVSLILGGLTSWGQYLLPSSLNPLANSISGWTMATALVVWFARAGVQRSAVLGALSFVALTVGYTIASAVRGFHYDPTTWAIVGLAAGPFVGAAVAVLRGDDGVHVAVGSGLLTGVLAGDALRGLTVVAATTPWVYWAVVAAISVSFAAVVAVRKLRSRNLVAVQLGSALAVAGALTLGVDVLVELVQQL